MLPGVGALQQLKTLAECKGEIKTQERWRIGLQHWGRVRMRQGPLTKKAKHVTATRVLI